MTKLTEKPEDLRDSENKTLNLDDKALSSEQTYDSALATMISKVQSCIVPLINEAFGEKFTENAKVEIENNKRVIAQIDGRLSRRETDAYVRISEMLGEFVQKCYHVECETWYDKSIVVRVAEYSSVIAADEAVVTKSGVELHFPNSVILFLRPNRAIPKKVTITHCAPNGEKLSYDVPTIQIADYSLDDIFDKKLLLLLPFALFRFANDFDEMEEDEGKRRKIGDALREIEERLDELLQAGEISAYQKLTIEDLLLRVSEKLTMRHEKIRKGVGEIMSGYILRTKADEWLDEAKQEGRIEGRQEGRIEGRQEGRQEGQREMADLMGYLLSNGRIEDAKKASTDQGALDRLLAEFKGSQAVVNEGEAGQAAAGGR